MHNYDYSFLKDYMITSKLIGLSNVIYESNARLRKSIGDNPELFKKLHDKAIIESTVSSSRIEGVETSAKREKELLLNREKPLNHDEEEISGYKDAIVFVSEHHDDLKINEQTIKHLHKLLMYYTQDLKGEYKRADNRITARYQDGSREILFEPIPHEQVDINMKKLLVAYNEAVNDSEINKMLLIPCFIIDFLAIHPFQDGNGRISRLLTLLLLYKQGYDIGKCISYEKMIEDYKWNYYQEINRSQIGWHENSNDYSSFIVFHFQILYRCYGEINRRMNDDQNSRKLSKQKRIEMTIFNSIIPLSKADIADALPDVSTTTIEKTLGIMLKEKKIRKIGSYKNARYIKESQ